MPLRRTAVRLSPAAVRPRLARLLLPALLAACAVPGLARAELPAPVGAALAAAGLPEDAVGALVIRLEDDRELVSHRPDAVMQPASTMKLVTTIVGLERLGPVHRGRTELRARGEVVDGTLWGDLIVRAGADPELTWETMQSMLRMLRDREIRRIRGDIVIDRTMFHPIRFDVGVPPFDETPEFRYNVIPDALLLNFNLLRFDLESTSNAIKLRMTPQLERVEIATDMTLVDGLCNDWEDGWKPPEVVRKGNGRLRIVLHGTFPRNCTAGTSLNLLDRTEYADRLIRRLWRELGGTIGGTTREALEPVPLEGTRLLAEHVSRPYADIIRDINKPSDNTLARLTYLGLGTLPLPAALPPAGSPATPAAVPGGGIAASAAAPAQAPSVPSAPAPTLARAETQVRDWFRLHGIDDDGMVIENGSGLSRLERLKPRQLALLLKAAARSNFAPEFLSSLPLAGLDGTMRRRLKDSPAAARARIKTGTLRNVVAVGGYVPDSRNRMHVVVAFINHEQAVSRVGRPVADALIDWVARLGSESEAAQARNERLEAAR